MDGEVTMRVCSVEEMRRLDRTAMERYGIPGEILMENAGEAVYFAMAGAFELAGERFLVLCGGGHNGGDGFVVARKLHSAGGLVRVMILSDPSRYDEAPALHLGMVERLGIPVEVRPSPEEIREALRWSGVVVDAMLGTGLDREVGGLYREAIVAVNASGRPVVAVDIPSGVHGDTGRVLGVAVEADLTVTFGLPKRGNLLYPGAGLCGELFLSHISFPPELAGDPGIPVSVNLPPPLPARRPDGHKGTFGDALFVAGAAGYFGAAAFSASAHLKAGGGYARLAAPAPVVPHLAGLAPEAVFVPQPATPAGTLSRDAVEGLVDLAGRVDFTVVGPGLSLEGETVEAVRRLAAAVPGPLLVDGDGLTAVAGEPGAIRDRSAPTVLTPHPGEMARLTGRTTAEVLADPIPLLQRTAADLGAVVVLKGARTLVGLPSGEVFLNVTGNDGMATAGSGDVLTGTISAMAGLGLAFADAVRAGVFVHGLAGDLAAESVGADGVTARTILGFLPEAVALFREEYAALTAGAAGAVTVL